MSYDKYEKEVAEWHAKYEESEEHGVLVTAAVDDWLQSRYSRPDTQDRDYYRHIKDQEERDILYEETGHYGITDIHGKLTTVASSQEIEVVRKDVDDDVSSIFHNVMPTDLLTVGEMYDMLLEDLRFMDPANRTILFEFIFGEWKSKRGFFTHIQKVLADQGTPMKRGTLSDRIKKGDFKGKERFTPTGGGAIVEWRALRTMQYYERFTYQGIPTYRRSLRFAEEIDKQRLQRKEEDDRILNLPKTPDGKNHPEVVELLVRHIRHVIVYRQLLPLMFKIRNEIGFWPVPKGGYTQAHFDRYAEVFEKKNDLAALYGCLKSDWERGLENVAQ